MIGYFRQQPLRLLYASVWLALLVAALYGGATLYFKAELFATLVRNPDHRMQRDDPHFNGLNSDNLRTPHEAATLRDSDFNILFLGDSFVYGFLLNPQQAPPAQLEQLLRERYGRQDINVINFGWTSSSPYLSLRLLQDLGARYRPDVVLLALDMSDYRDEWFYKSLLLGRGAYGWIRDYPRTAYVLKRVQEWLEPLVDWHTAMWGYSGQGGYFVARQPMAQSQNLFDDVYDTLVQIDRYSRDTLHTPFMVFIPPRHWQYTTREAPDSWENGGFDPLGPYALENFHYFAQQQARAPFPLVPLLEDFRQTDRFPLHFKVDSHWNKHGARFFAERVARHAEAAGLWQPLGKPVQSWREGVQDQH